VTKNRDWNKIKAEYITTNTSYAKLSQKHGVPQSMIRKRGAAEEWVKQRNDFRTKTVTKAVSKASVNQSNILFKELMLASKISAVLERALKDAEQFNRYIVTVGNANGPTEVLEKVFKKVDTKALKEIAEILRIVEDLKRRMNNMLTAQDLQKIKLEQEKLQINREKLEIEKVKLSGADLNDEGTGVVELPAKLMQEV